MVARYYCELFAAAARDANLESTILSAAKPQCTRIYGRRRVAYTSIGYTRIIYCISSDMIFYTRVSREHTRRRQMHQRTRATTKRPHPPPLIRVPANLLRARSLYAFIRYFPVVARSKRHCGCETPSWCSSCSAQTGRGAHECTIDVVLLHLQRMQLHQATTLRNIIIILYYTCSCIAVGAV